jgi:hypothetical protein
VHIPNGDVEVFEFDGLFSTGKNGPVIDEQRIPVYLTESIETL